MDDIEKINSIKKRIKNTNQNNKDMIWYKN
jgi:hypothetical protein